MPIISLFSGIVIRMYFDDHPPAHCHASYQGFEAFTAIETSEVIHVIHGSLPRKACAPRAARRKHRAPMGAEPPGGTQGKLAARRRPAAHGADPGADLDD